MNEWMKRKLYSTLLKEKTVRPGVREISPVSIYGEVYGGKNFRKRCVLSLEWKKGVIDGDIGGDDNVYPTCVGYWEGERPGCAWMCRLSSVSQSVCYLWCECIIYLFLFTILVANEKKINNERKNKQYR